MFSGPENARVKSLSRPHGVGSCGFQATTKGQVLQIKSKRMALVAAVASAGIAATALMPIAADAVATTYKITNGGAITAKQSGALVFVDTTSTSHPKLTCTAFTGSGTAFNGRHKFAPKTYKSGTTIAAAATLTTQSLTGCTNPITGAATITPSNSWSFAFSSRTTGGGVGYLYNVTAKVSAAGCVFNSKGAVYGTYTNSTGIFKGTTKAGLVVSNVTGASCALVGVANGDRAYLSGKIKITPAFSVKRPT